MLMALNVGVEVELYPYRFEEQARAFRFIIGRIYG